MKKRTVVVFFLSVLIVFTAFQAAAGEDAVRDLQQILDSGKVVVAMVDEEYPPFITRSEDGGPAGLEVDLARDIADKLGVSLEIVEAGHLDGVVDRVAAGEADIGISNLSITCERAKLIKYTDTYRTLGLVLLQNRLKMASSELTIGVKHPDQLRSIRGPIGVIRRSAYEDTAREYFPNADLKTFDRYEDMIRAAEAGELLLAVGNNLTVDAFLNKSPHLVVRLHPVMLEDLRDPIAMAVGAESDHLLAWLNAYLTVKGLGGR